MMLAACNITINGPEDKSNKAEETVLETDEAVLAEVDDGEETEKTDERGSEGVGEETTLDLEEVFIKMKEASKTINRVVITIDSKSTTTMSGVTRDGTSTLAGKLQVDPAIEHITHTVM